MEEKKVLNKEEFFESLKNLELDPGVPVTSIRKPAGGFSFARKRKLSEIEKGRQFYQNYRPDMAEREGFEDFSNSGNIEISRKE